MRTFLIVVPAILALACQRDPGGDVGPTSAAAIMSLEEIPRSQRAEVSQHIANTEITVSYSRPVARGRALFGSLVPYDEIWHPGADRATAIAVTRDVHINNRSLPAGRYSLWTIPRPEIWTVIFSRAADVFHMPYPGDDHDALRLDVGAEMGAHMEALMFYFPAVDGKDAILRLHWGDVMVPLEIRVP